MTRIVTTVEQEDLHFIGIFCTAGHHRSVACGELLLKHVYPKAKLIHLTLNKNNLIARKEENVNYVAGVPTVLAGPPAISSRE